jgi:hypothetical protein
MNNILKVAVTSLAVAALCAPLTAQQRGGRVVVSPAEQRGRVVTGGVVVEDNTPRPQAFSVSLVLGDMQGASAPDNVPAAARKALTDIKDFLPYKSFRLLDSQWTLCCGQSILTRLRGPEDQDYALELNPRTAPNGKWSVRFALWEPRTGETAISTAGGADARREIDTERAALEQQLAELKKTHGDTHPDVMRLRRRIEALDQQSLGFRDELSRRTLAASLPRRAIIDTSFTMEVGETVVVGTSRLKGDKALIALLTAVAPAKNTTK